MIDRRQSIMLSLNRRADHRGIHAGGAARALLRCRNSIQVTVRRDAAMPQARRKSLDLAILPPRGLNPPTIGSDQFSWSFNRLADAADVLWPAV